MGTEVASDPGPILNDAALNVLAWKEASLRGKVLPVKLQGPGVHGIENVVDISKESAAVCGAVLKADPHLHPAQICGIRSCGVEHEHPSFF